MKTATTLATLAAVLMSATPAVSSAPVTAGGAGTAMTISRRRRRVRETPRGLRVRLQRPNH